MQKFPLKKGLSENSSTENNVQENISEVFDIENID